MEVGVERRLPAIKTQSLAHTIAGAQLYLHREQEKQFQSREYKTLDLAKKFGLHPLSYNFLLIPFGMM